MERGVHHAHVCELDFISWSTQAGPPSTHCLYLERASLGLEIIILASKPLHQSQSGSEIHVAL
jgi:hypothetical protein